MKLSCAVVLALTIGAPVGCGSRQTAARGAPVAGADAAVRWSPLGAAAFARARAEGRYLLLDCSAEWCHWCHVMDATTYRDPAVLQAIGERFVAVRVDIDTDPDISARYIEWGWPATVLFAPDGTEIARFRGYLAPQRLLASLRDVERLARDARSTDASAEAEPALTAEQLRALGPGVTAVLDGYYDRAEGSWGDWQKLSIGANVEFELRRWAHGDTAARARARFTLERSRALLDPVWGGVYQYSSGRRWDDPHYEKLMRYQAPTMAAFALAGASLEDAGFARDARSIAGYVNGFLRHSTGLYHASQDADLNAHEPGLPFVEGRRYFSLDDRGRRALGLPRVAPELHPVESGQALRALSVLCATGCPPGLLATLRASAGASLAAFVDGDGRVLHAEGVRGGTRFLADAAELGLGLASLASVDTDVDSRRGWTEAAARIGERLLRDFAAPDGGPLVAHTGREGMTGTLGRPDRPTDANVTAARLFAALARVTNEPAHRWRARRLLSAVATPRRVRELGRFVGDLLLALDEAGVYPWSAVPPPIAETEGDHWWLSAELRPTGTALVELATHDGWHLNEPYPTTVTLSVDGGAVTRSDRRGAARFAENGAHWELPRTEAPAGAAVTVRVRFALCSGATCLPQEAMVRVGR